VNSYHWGGHDFAVGYRRESALLDSLSGACERILRQLAKSDLPEDARAQVSDEMGRVLGAAAELRASLNDNSAANAIEHVVKAAGYLDSLADQLARNGVADSERGRRLIRVIEAEAGGLIREAGGGYTDRSPQPYTPSSAPPQGISLSPPPSPSPPPWGGPRSLGDITRAINLVRQ
jgi:hypothetical protein